MCQQTLEELLSTPKHRGQYKNEWRVYKGMHVYQEEQWKSSGGPSRGAACFV